MALGATWLSDHPWHRGACVRSTGHERSLTPKKRHDERPWSPEPWFAAARRCSKPKSWPWVEGWPTAPRASVERGRGVQVCPDPAGLPVL